MSPVNPSRITTKFLESTRTQLSEKSKTLIKKCPLSGTLTNIRLTEDLQKENSKMSLRPLMFSQTTTEDPLMIEWFLKNLHSKMPTKYSIGFSDKMKWSLKKRKSSWRKNKSTITNEWSRLKRVVYIFSFLNSTIV